MSEENRDMEAGEAEVAIAPSVGSQLKAAREAKQMSISDIAMALKLGPRQVEALEKGDWQRLPGHTFIRGFVRNYARLLQIDAAPLMGQLDSVLELPQQRLALPEQKRQVAMPEIGSTHRRDYAMVFSGLALVAVAAGIYFLLPSDLSAIREGLDSVLSVLSKKEPAPESSTGSSAPGSSTEPVFPPGTTPQQVMNPQAVQPGDAMAGAPAAPPALTPPPVAVPPLAVPPAVVPPAPAQSPAESPSMAPPPVTSPAPTPASTAPAAPPAGKSAAGNASLSLSFDQESWVEVRDRNGKILLSKRSAPGTEQSLDGQPPFTLIIGNAPGVKLTWRGQSVNLAPHSRGNVARLTLE